MLCLEEAIAGLVELVLDSGSCGITPTTVVDLTGEAPLIARQGKASSQLFGL